MDGGGGGGLPRIVVGEVKDVTQAEITDLRDKVEALVRALMGSESGQQKATGGVLGKRDRGLDRILCADGFDERTGQHTTPRLTRREMIECVGEAATRLDEATRRAGELFADPRAPEQVIVPAEMVHDAGLIPASTVAILTPEVAEARSQLAVASAPRRKLTDAEKIAFSRTVDASRALLQRALRTPVARMQVYSLSNPADHKPPDSPTHPLTRLMQTDRKLEPGWSDPGAEQDVVAAALVGSKTDPPYGVIAAAVAEGLQARDFRDESCRRVWEAIEKVRGQIKKDAASVTGLLRKDVPGDGGAILLKKLEAHGRKQAQHVERLDVPGLVASIILKARLRRMTDATTKGVTPHPTSSVCCLVFPASAA